MLNFNRSLQGGFAASDDFLDTAADRQQSDSELAREFRTADDRDLAPIIGMILAVGLSLPFWWALILALL